jgi:hypothetical protein
MSNRLKDNVIGSIVQAQSLHPLIAEAKISTHLGAQDLNASAQPSNAPAPSGPKNDTPSM